MAERAGMGPQGSGLDRFLPAPRRSRLVAASVAVALHVALLLVALGLAERARPPDQVVSVEIAWPPSATEAPSGQTAAADAAPAAEPVREIAPPEATAAAPPGAVPVVRAVRMPPTEPPSDAVPAQPAPPDAAPPSPEPELASAAPSTADAPAELLHARAPPPGAVETAEAPPMPIPPQPPHPPRPARPHPPRPRPMGRPEAREAAAAPTAPTAERQLPAPAAAPAPAGAAAPHPTPAATAPSDAVPTWRGEVVARLRRAQHYPEEARSRSEQGVVTASFTLDRAGHVLSASVVRSSGVEALDDAAADQIRRAAPFPAMPAEMPGATVTLSVPIAFTLRRGDG